MNNDVASTRLSPLSSKYMHTRTKRETETETETERERERERGRERERVVDLCRKCVCIKITSDYKQLTIL